MYLRVLLYMKGKNFFDFLFASLSHKILPEKILLLGQHPFHQELTLIEQ